MQIKDKIPSPQSYYVSPLNRCLATASITFKDLGLPHTEPFRPVIKEVSWDHQSLSLVLNDSPLELSTYVPLSMSIPKQPKTPQWIYHAPLQA